MRALILGLLLLAGCSSIPDKCKPSDAPCPEPVGACKTAKVGDPCAPDAGTCPGCNRSAAGHSTALTCTQGPDGGLAWVSVSGIPDPDCAAR